MSKEEIIEAINATIVPNNVKGITAESLANLLTEMVNASGSGGGTGGGVVFYVGEVDLNTFEATQTPEEKAHNAEMFQVVANSPTGVAVGINVNNLYGEQVGTNVGFTCVEMLSSVLYVSEEFAVSQGASSAMINAYSGELDVIIYPDGTLELSI